MAFHSFENGIDPRVSNLLNRVPALARYTRTRGVTFVISWAHRLTGVLLVIFIGFHIYTLSSLTTPGAYADKMKLYQLPLLAFIEWALVLPVMFHALNGGRLILYESFRCRKDEVLLNWVVGLGHAYLNISLGQRLTYDLAGDLLARLQQLSLRFHAGSRVGDNIRRLTADSTCLSTILKDALLPVLLALVSLVTMFAILWGIDPQLARNSSLR